MLRGGESGPGIVASHPDKSLLLQKVKTGAMPPAKKDALSPPQVLVLERWIAAGAAGATGQPANGLIPPNQHDIIPIMLRRCSVCHGGHRQEAGLDLRTRAGMLRGGKSGPALVAGNPDASRMLQKVQAGQMPPHDRLVEVSVKPMEGAETDLLARWIALGAPEVAIQPDIASTVPDPLVSDKDRDFWAFRAPRPITRHRQTGRQPGRCFHPPGPGGPGAGFRTGSRPGNFAAPGQFRPDRHATGTSRAGGICRQ